MILTFKERVCFGNLLPREGNMIAQIIAKDVMNKIAISQEEIEKVQLKVTGQGTTWNDVEGQKLEKTFEFTKPEIEFLKNQIIRLDKEEKISQDILSICIKIKEAKG